MIEDSSSRLRYWEERKDFIYYKVVKVLLDALSADAKSMLDVGSSGCPYLDWFPAIPIKTSLDIENPHFAEGVVSITEDYLTWQPDRQYDVVTCMQVLEHVRPARAFARKLLASGKIVVASVPYKWPKGVNKDHVHDPVDEFKMYDWFGRRPNYEYICREMKSDVSRLIHVYDSFRQPWDSINRRNAILKKMAENEARVKSELGAASSIQEQSDGAAKAVATE